MKIYIDESGSFAKKDTVGDSWNVVAAYVIPNRSEEKLSDLIIKCRELTKKQEPKISDFLSDRTLIDAINGLSDLNGTLFAAIINRSINESVLHDQVCAIDSKEMGEDCNQISGNTQLQLQANIFFELLNSTFWGAWIRYGKATPHELKLDHEWLVDEKCHRYENFVRKTIHQYMRGEYFRYVYEFNPPTNNTITNPNRLMPAVLSNLVDSNLKSLINQQRAPVAITPKNAFDNLRFCNSEEVDGIQIAGILAGAIRGCLMGKYGKSNKIISRSLGRLMIKKPKGLSITPKSGNGIPDKDDRFIPIFDKLSSDDICNRSLIIMRSSAINIYG